MAATLLFWLDGGWGVDALLSGQTRDHDDLDLIVREDHVPRMRGVLHEHGFRRSGGVPVSFVLRDERGREVDVHPVRFDDGGNGHLEGDDRGPYEHPANAFAAAGIIAGRRVACLSAEAQMANHAGGMNRGQPMSTTRRCCTNGWDRAGAVPPMSDTRPRSADHPDLSRSGQVDQ